MKRGGLVPHVARRPISRKSPRSAMASRDGTSAVAGDEVVNPEKLAEGDNPRTTFQGWA